jgi:hemolysin activation/secretion protein
MDGWVGPKFNNSNTPDPNVNYVYQGLALNLRGYDQNAANGDKAMTINSELRLPIFTTFFNKPINNAFLRNFQLTQFVDLGTAWTSTFGRPTVTYTDRDVSTATVTPVSILIKPAGIGPFLGGYGFGIRSTLLGYFLKLDAGWPMTGFFAGGPKLYFSLGFDF